MRLIFLALFILIILSGCASAFMLFPSTGQRIEAMYPTPDLKTSSFVKTVVVTNNLGNKIGGILIEPPNAKGTVMVSGGNAMLRRQTAYYYRFLVDKNFRVLFFSFQGFDENEGEANINSMLSDAGAFFDYLQHQYPNQKIAYVGDSISSAVALCLPKYGKSLSAIAVEGAVDPSSIAYDKLYQLWYLFPFYPILAPTAISVSLSVPKELDVSLCMASLNKTPVLFIHHPNDLVTPFRKSFELFDAYSGPKEFLIPKSGDSEQNHLNLWEDKKLRAKLVDFLQQHTYN